MSWGVLAAHPPDPPLAPRECGSSDSEIPLARLHEVEARSYPALLAAVATSPWHLTRCSTLSILPTVRMLRLVRVPVAGPPQAHLSVLLRVLVLRSIRPP